MNQTQSDDFPQVNIIKSGGYWHLLVNDCSIRTPYTDDKPRALVISYAHNIFPRSEIVQ